MFRITRREHVCKRVESGNRECSGNSEKWILEHQVFMVNVTLLSYQTVAMAYLLQSTKSFFPWGVFVPVSAGVVPTAREEAKAQSGVKVVVKASEVGTRQRQ